MRLKDFYPVKYEPPTLREEVAGGLSWLMHNVPDHKLLIVTVNGVKEVTVGELTFFKVGTFLLTCSITALRF